MSTRHARIFRRRAVERGRRRDERGGAVSLLVLLMVPVAAFAAVVAMAGPQRLAAESSVQEAADDLAAIAVAWRDGQGTASGPLPAFFGDCDALTAEQRRERDTLDSRIGALEDETDSNDPGFVELVDELVEDLVDGPGAAFGDRNVDAAQIEAQILSKRDLRYHFDRLYGTGDGHIASWEAACRAMSEALERDLWNLGVDVDSLRGFYSDSLTESFWWSFEWGPAECSDSIHPDRAACEGAGETWTPRPCRIGAEVLVHDAVHVALAADWRYAGWAATQVWPDGISMGAESMGRLARRVDALPAGSLTYPCEDSLVMFDEAGRPVWAGSTSVPDSRRLAGTVQRTGLSR